MEILVSLLKEVDSGYGLELSSGGDIAMLVMLVVVLVVVLVVGAIAMFKVFKESEEYSQSNSNDNKCIGNIYLMGTNLKSDGTRYPATYHMSKLTNNEYETNKINIRRGAILKVFDGSRWYGYHDSLPSFVTTNKSNDLIFNRSGSFKITLNNKKEINIIDCDTEENL